MELGCWWTVLAVQPFLTASAEKVPPCPGSKKWTCTEISGASGMGLLYKPVVDGRLRNLKGGGKKGIRAVTAFWDIGSQRRAYCAVVDNNLDQGAIKDSKALMRALDEFKRAAAPATTVTTSPPTTTSEEAMDLYGTDPKTWENFSASSMPPSKKPSSPPEQLSTTLATQPTPSLPSTSPPELFTTTQVAQPTTPELLTTTFELFTTTPAAQPLNTTPELQLNTTQPTEPNTSLPSSPPPEQPNASQPTQSDNEGKDLLGENLMHLGLPLSGHVEIERNQSTKNQTDNLNVVSNKFVSDAGKGSLANVSDDVSDDLLGKDPKTWGPVDPQIVATSSGSAPSVIASANIRRPNISKKYPINLSHTNSSRTILVADAGGNSSSSIVTSSAPSTSILGDHYDRLSLSRLLRKKKDSAATDLIEKVVRPVAIAVGGATEGDPTHQCKEAGEGLSISAPCVATGTGSIRLFFKGLQVGHSYTMYCSALDLPKLYCQKGGDKSAIKMCLGKPKGGTIVGQGGGLFSGKADDIVKVVFNVSEDDGKPWTMPVSESSATDKAKGTGGGYIIPLLVLGIALAALSLAGFNFFKRRQAFQARSRIRLTEDDRELINPAAMNTLQAPLSGDFAPLHAGPE